MSLSNLLQITLEMWGCMISLILAILTSSYIHEKDKVARLLWTMLLINTLTLAGDALAYVYRGDNTDIGRVLTHTANFVVFATEYLFAAVFTFYTDRFLDGIRPAGKQKPGYIDLLMKGCVFLSVLDLALLIFSQFSGFYYYFDNINNYHRGPGFLISMALMGVVLIINIIRLILCGKWMDEGAKETFLIGMIIPVFAYIIQSIRYGFSLINIAITVSLLIMYFRHMLATSQMQYNDDMEAARSETKMVYEKYYEAVRELEEMKKERGDNA